MSSSPAQIASSAVLNHMKLRLHREPQQTTVCRHEPPSIAATAPPQVFFFLWKLHSGNSNWN